MPSKGQKAGVYVKCEVCGKEIYKTPYQYKIHKNHFCSQECSIEYRHRAHTDIRQCEFCGKQFTVRKSMPNRFCSPECQHEWQKTNVGPRNVRFTRQLHACDYCGKEYYVKKYKLESGGNLFCSTGCRQNWYANVWSQQDEWKEESRERALKILAEGRVSKINSAPQQIIDSVLDGLKVNYKKEHGIGGFSIDNYLLDYSLCIEVMGDYWHASPLKYDYPERDAQKKTVMRDIRKRQTLINETGVAPLYLWESDIYKDKKMCRALIKEFIKNNGTLSNYNSFNYTMDGKKLCRKDETIVPFQEKGLS